MKSLIFILLFIFSTLSFAQENNKGINFNQDEVIQVLDTAIGSDLTCLDEYLLREKKLKRFLVWAPPVTLVGAPTAFAIGGFSTAAVLSATGATGWNAIGYTVLGAFRAGASVIGTFLTMETIKGIQFSNMRKMTNLIVASHNNLYDSKALIRLHRKYTKKYPADEVSKDALAKTIVMLDETGMLCNGEVRGRFKALKLKHRLARRRDLIKYIHNNFNLL